MHIHPNRAGSSTARRLSALVLAAATVAGLASGCTSMSGQPTALGFNVVPEQEKLVSVGMTPEQVLQAIGRPMRNMKYRNQPGPTFTYRVNDYRQMLFDVDFDESGKVRATSERMEMIGGPSDRGL